MIIFSVLNNEIFILNLITLQSIALQHFINEKCQNSFYILLDFLLKIFITAGKFFKDLYKLERNDLYNKGESCITLLLLSSKLVSRQGGVV